mmetsp:Transcript_25158/g.38594  ORF Transcript_25158/g.38594 Transcript_25158/m.38594 type:complete len:85 (-) Transcript_25158:1856-2110(-)
MTRDDDNGAGEGSLLEEDAPELPRSVARLTTCKDMMINKKPPTTMDANAFGKMLNSTCKHDPSSEISPQTGLLMIVFVMDGMSI